jgi:hypothetical protein
VFESAIGKTRRVRTCPPRHFFLFAEKSASLIVRALYWGVKKILEISIPPYCTGILKDARSN